MYHVLTCDHCGLKAPMSNLPDEWTCPRCKRREKVIPPRWMTAHTKKAGENVPEPLEAETLTPPKTQLLDCTICEFQLTCVLRKEPVDIAACLQYTPGTPSLLPSATILRLEPGDALVFKCPWTLDGKQREDLERFVDRNFPGHAFTVLEQGSDLQVVRPAKATEAGK